MRATSDTVAASNAPTASRKPRKPRRKHERRRIKLSDTEELIPRRDLAEELGVTERTLQNLNTAVILVANIAYVRRTEALEAFVKQHTRGAPEPPKARRRR